MNTSRNDTPNVAHTKHHYEATTTKWTAKRSYKITKQRPEWIHNEMTLRLYTYKLITEVSLRNEIPYHEATLRMKTHTEARLRTETIQRRTIEHWYNATVPSNTDTIPPYSCYQTEQLAPNFNQSIPYNINRSIRYHTKQRTNQNQLIRHIEPMPCLQGCVGNILKVCTY